MIFESRAQFMCTGKIPSVRARDDPSSSRLRFVEKSLLSLRSRWDCSIGAKQFIFLIQFTLAFRKKYRNHTKKKNSRSSLPDRLYIYRGDKLLRWNGNFPKSSAHCQSCIALVFGVIIPKGNKNVLFTVRERSRIHTKKKNVDTIYPVACTRENINAKRYISF